MAQRSGQQRRPQLGALRATVRRASAAACCRLCGLRWRISGSTSCSNSAASRSADCRQPRRWRASTPRSRKPAAALAMARSLVEYSAVVPAPLPLTQPERLELAELLAGDARQAAQLAGAERVAAPSRAAGAARRCAAKNWRGRIRRRPRGRRCRLGRRDRPAARRCVAARPRAAAPPGDGRCGTVVPRRAPGRSPRLVDCRARAR